MDKLIRSNSEHVCGFWSWFSVRNQSNESEVNANDTPKEPGERKNSNEIEAIEDASNEENITAIAID